MTETEFVAASGLKPVEVEFSTGASALCLAVAPIDDAPEALQECLAAFVANCARARLPRHASPATRNAVGDALEWERGLAPALHGGFFIEARDETVERRLHGEILQGLERALKARGIACVAERVGAYGPDLFTWHDPRALFSIRSRATAADVFEGVGQLQIYERLLGNGYRKVLVMPDLPAEPMARMLGALNVRMLGFRWRGRAVRFDPEALETCLGA